MSTWEYPFKIHAKTLDKRLFIGCFCFIQFSAKGGGGIARKETEISPEHIRFADEYLIDFNATQAYLRAFGGDTSSARRCASRLLQKAEIRKYMSEKMKGIAEQTKVTPEILVGRLAAVSKADIADYLQIDDSGKVRPVPLEELSAEQRLAIAEIYRTSNGVRIKLYDRMEAIRLLGQYLGIFSGGAGSEDTLAEARKLLGGIKSGF